MDETQKPIKISPEFSNYAEKHNLFDLFKRMVSSIIKDKPDDPLSYIIQYLEKKNDDVPQIFILGPTLSGKITLANSLSKLLDVVLVDMINLQSEKEFPPAMLKQLKSCHGDTYNVPSNDLAKLLKTKLTQPDPVKKGWIIKGVINSREQAISLSEHGIFPKHCVVLAATESVLMERFNGGFLDPLTQEIYYKNKNMPKDQRILDRLEPIIDDSWKSTITKIDNYNRHNELLLECYKNVSKVFDANQPIEDLLAQVKRFICQPSRSLAPHTPRIILLGPPGCGKKTQAAVLAKKYGINQISIEDLIKIEIINNTNLGQQCKTYHGRITPDELLFEILLNKISTLNCASCGWILIGFPRNKNQAEFLDASEYYANRVIFFELADEVIIERLSLRALDPVTGNKYHMLYNPPNSLEIKERLKVHPNDTQESLKDAIETYQKIETELKDYYGSLGQVIGADQDAFRISEIIESLIVNHLPIC